MFPHADPISPRNGEQQPFSFSQVSKAEDLNVALNPNFFLFSFTGLLIVVDGDPEVPTIA